MANYLSVWSNDTLTHKALSGSPETLCGKLISDKVQPRDNSVNESRNPTVDIWHTEPLVCDICEQLSNNDSFITESAWTPNPLYDTGAKADCPYCEDGFDSAGDLCWKCGGTGRVHDEDYDELAGIDVDNLSGTRVASASCENCGGPTDGVTTRVGNEDWCTSCASAPYDQHHEDAKTQQIERLRSSSRPSRPRKFATNWTRDGIPIKDGFEVTITKEEAARIPFLDFSRVSVSEKRECPDCKQSHWLNRIASCEDCGTLKCINCMEDVGLTSFVGMCKKCASADSDITYESNYEDLGPYVPNFLDIERDEQPLFIPPDGS